MKSVHFLSDRIRRWLRWLITPDQALPKLYTKLHSYCKNWQIIDHLVDTYYAFHLEMYQKGNARREIFAICHWSLSSKPLWPRQPFSAHSVTKLIFADISGHKIRNSTWQKKKEDNFAGGRNRQGHWHKGSGHAQGRLKGSVKHSFLPEWYLLANHKGFCILFYQKLT